MNYANALRSLGNAYQQKGDINKGIKYSKNALDMYEKLEAQKSIGYEFTMIDIGLFYYRKGDFDEAIEYFKKVLDVHEKLEGQESGSYRLAQLALQTLGLSY